MYPFRSTDLFSPNPASPQEKIRTAYNRAFINWQAWWVEAYRDQSFYLNNQWTAQERFYLQQENRPDYVFNLCRRAVNMVQGYERKNRLSLVVEAVELSSSKTADIFTKCMYHVMRESRGHYAISDAFKGALTTGIGWIGVEMDYREDPLNGDVKLKFYPWNSILPDPFFTQRDLSDCDFLVRRSYMDKQEAISRFPEKEEMISKMQGNMRDDLFTFLPEQRIFQSQNLLAYTEYWEQQWKEIHVVINPLTLQEIEVTARNSKQLAPLLKIDGIKSFKRQKKVIKWYGMLNNEVVAEGEDPFGVNEYPFVPIIAVYEPEYDLYQYKLQSMIRCIRDPQIEFNKRISKMTDLIDSQINSGWLVKKSKFDNYADFYKTGQGRVIFAKDHADLMGDARKLEPGQIPQGLFEMQQLFNQLCMNIFGGNEELLASADDDKAGILSMLRQGAALVNLQDLFDNLRQSKEIIGNKIVRLIQGNWTPEKVFMVTKEKPTPEFYFKNFGKYDSVCVEAPLTETQRQLHAQQLLSLKEMGAPISWKRILEKMPFQGEADLVEEVAQAEQQQQQMAQAQMQAEQQDKTVVNHLLIEEARSKNALAKERLAKAEEDRSGAALNRAKTASEIDSIDMDGINKFIDTIVKLENAGREPAEQEMESEV
jgi:hypothetical protein